MTVTIYNYTDDAVRLDKSGHITQLAQYTGNVRDSVDIVTPEILIDGNVLNGNYCYVDTFAAYYYIIEKTVVRNNLTQLTLKRDAAMTFLAGILQSNCVCLRNGKNGNYNSDFPDNKYKTLQNRYTETFAFSETLGTDDAIVFAFVE